MSLSTMKAVTFHGHGGPEQLAYETVPAPTIGAGEVLIRVKACALNHLDIWVRQGIPSYQISLPHISGCDISGIIEQVIPPHPRHLSRGQAVLVSPGLSCGQCPVCEAGQENLCSQFQVVGAQVDGGYAEFVKVPAMNVLPIPVGVTFEQAAAFPLVSVTAWHMLMTLAKVKRGETVLVMGAGSGVGSMAVQMANLIGARTFGTVGSDNKVEKAKMLGAEAVFNHSTDHIATSVKKLTDGRGVDVVIEHIGERVWEQCIQAMANGGRLVTCGATTGGQLSLDARYLFSRQLTIMGSYLGTRAELVRAVDHMAAGALRPVIDSVYPLQEARAAQVRMLDRQVFGKIVLVPETSGTSV